MYVKLQHAVFILDKSEEVDSESIAIANVIRGFLKLSHTFDKPQISLLTVPKGVNTALASIKLFARAPRVTSLTEVQELDIIKAFLGSFDQQFVVPR